MESATGLKLIGHRYYDSSIGRFLTRDPIKNGRNWYVYCGSNPVQHVDPQGLFLQAAWAWIKDRLFKPKAGEEQPPAQQAAPFVTDQIASNADGEIINLSAPRAATLVGPMLTTVEGGIALGSALPHFAGSITRWQSQLEYDSEEQDDNALTMSAADYWRQAGSQRYR